MSDHMIVATLPWKVYLTPTHAWVAPEVPEGIGILVASFATFQEAHNALVLSCKTSREGYYIPREVAKLDTNNEQAMQAAIESFTSRLASLVIATGG